MGQTTFQKNLITGTVLSLLGLAAYFYIESNNQNIKALEIQNENLKTSTRLEIQQIEIKYKDISEKKQEQIIVQKIQISNLEEQNDSLKANVKSLKQTLSIVQNQLKKKNSKLAVLLLANDSLKKEVKSKIEANEQLTSQLNNANEKILNQNKIIASLEEDIRTSKNLNKSLTNQIKSFESNQQATEKQLNQFQKELDKTKNELKKSENRLSQEEKADYNYNIGFQYWNAYKDKNRKLIKSKKGRNLALQEARHYFEIAANLGKDNARKMIFAIDKELQNL